jgi:hypothetical protein
MEMPGYGDSAQAAITTRYFISKLTVRIFL